MNVVAERINNTSIEKVRTIISESELSEFSVNAVLYSAHIVNRSLSVGQEVTASELWAGRRPDVSNFRVFGCIAYNHVPKEKKTEIR